MKIPPMSSTLRAEMIQNNRKRARQMILLFPHGVQSSTSMPGARMGRISRPGLDFGGERVAGHRAGFEKAARHSVKARRRRCKKATRAPPPPPAPIG
jgi:hypothetical protein